MKKRPRSIKDASEGNKFLDIENLAAVCEEEDSLLFCWNLILSGENREMALTFALEGEAILDKKLKKIIKNPANSPELLRIFTCYNIVSIAYTWNNLFENAQKNDFLYLQVSKFWPLMCTELEAYLELLLVKKRTTYLKRLFSDVKFRNLFLPHYEVFILLLMNPDHECNCMEKVTRILNRVRNEMSKYL